jgi:hypothetical protein
LAYFKIGENDYSMYVSELKVSRATTFRAQTNAAGNTVVDNSNGKLTIEVGIIPLDDEVMKKILSDIYNFEVYITFLNPLTGDLESGLHCIIPTNQVEYYTIRANKVQFKAFNLTFTEL